MVGKYIKMQVEVSLVCKHFSISILHAYIQEATHTYLDTREKAVEAGIIYRCPS